MSIPKFEDIGKRSHQILSGFYDTGSFSLKLKSKDSGNEFAWESRIEDKCRVSFGSKVDVTNYGMQLQEKWNTDNVVFGEMALCDTLIRGSRLGMTGSMMPQSGQLAGALTANLVRNNVRLDMAMANEQNNVKYNNGLVFKVQDWLVGYQFGGPGPLKESLQNGTLCLGYVDNNLEACVLKQANKDLVATICNKSNASMETSFKLTFDGKSSQFELGVVLKQCTNCQLLAKVDTNATVSVGWNSQLSPALTAKLWSQIDGKAKQGNFIDRCKFGFGLECEF